jgi:hypothetical protein
MNMAIFKAKWRARAVALMLIGFGAGLMPAAVQAQDYSFNRVVIEGNLSVDARVSKRAHPLAPPP